MSNIVQSFDLSVMPAEMKAALLQSLMADQMTTMQKKFDETSKRLLTNVNDLQIQTEGIQNGLAEMKETINAVSDKQTFLNKTDDLEWLTLTNIGRNLNPTLNKDQMPALLRKLGIINVWGKIEPLSKYMNTKEPLAIKRKGVNSYGVEYFSYHFSEKRLLKLIEHKLTKIGRYIEFKSLINSKEVWDFINSL